MQSSNAGEAGLWPHALSTAMEEQSLLSSLASQWHQHFVPLTVSVLGQWMKPWWNQGTWMNSGWPTTSSSNFQPVEKIALPRTFGNSSMYCNGWLPITRSKNLSWTDCVVVVGACILSLLVLALVLVPLVGCGYLFFVGGDCGSSGYCACDCGNDFDWVAVGDIGSPKHGACKMR